MAAKTWEIRASYGVCSMWYSSAKTEAAVLEEWKAHTKGLGYAIPEGPLTAIPYLSTALDRFGVGRGG